MTAAPAPADNYISVSDFAAAKGCDVRTVRRMVAAGQLPKPFKVKWLDPRGRYFRRAVLNKPAPEPTMTAADVAVLFGIDNSSDHLRRYIVPKRKGAYTRAEIVAALDQREFVTEAEIKWRLGINDWQLFLLEDTGALPEPQRFTRDGAPLWYRVPSDDHRGADRCWRDPAHIVAKMSQSIHGVAGWKAAATVEPDGYQDHAAERSRKVARCLERNAERRLARQLSERWAAFQRAVAGKGWYAAHTPDFYMENEAPEGAQRKPYRKGFCADPETWERLAGI